MSKVKQVGSLTIMSAKLTAKTKAGRDKQWKKIMEESERICAEMERQSTRKEP